MKFYSQPHSLFEKLYDDLSRRFSQQLFDELLQQESLQPRLTLSTVLSFVGAGLVHGLTLGLVLLGIYLVYFGWPNIVLVILGVFCFLAAIPLRPQFAPFPKSTLARDKCPKLYELADNVAQRLAVKPVDGIVITRRFMAAYGRASWRGQHKLWLGMPFLAALDNQEKIALVTHELGHAANGDIYRSTFVGSAVRALSTWHGYLRPDYLPRAQIQTAMASLATPIANVALVALSVIPYTGAYLLSRLMFRDSQRAEYLADQLSMEVGGRDAIISALQKILLASATILRTGMAFRGKGDIFTELKRRLSDSEALKQAEKTSLESDTDYRLDSTHPPTPFRIKMLRAHSTTSAPLVLPAYFFEQLDQELAPIQAQMQAEIEKFSVALASF